ncbi:MAG: aminotransferase class V-fold PLP-dependent enzyme [Rubripirellula sp.]
MMKTDDVYLNHAGTSWPKPSVVSEAVREAMATPPGEWPLRFDEAHQSIAEFFGVARRDQLLLTPGCTSALAVGIGDALIASGKRVLTSRWEHHALHRPLLKLVSSGVRVEYIPTKLDATQGLVEPIDLDWLEDTLSQQDVGLVAITAACNVTGELLPYEEVIQIGHQHGAMVIIDAAQIVGWMKLDLTRLGADMVAFGGHKGLQAPWGIGGLYLSDRVSMECVSATCGLPSTDVNDASKWPRPGYCDVGSVDQFALAGLHAAIRMLSTMEIDGCLSEARNQIRRIRATLELIDGVRFLGAAGVENAMPSLAFALSGFTSGEVASQLKRNGLVVGSGFQCAPLVHETLGTAESGITRLSVGLGQSNDDIGQATERLKLALSQDSFQRKSDSNQV